MKNLNLLGTLLMSGALIACGGGSPKSASDKPDTLFPDGYTPISSSSSSSSSSEGGFVNTPLPLHENFNGAVDGDGFFSDAYKALANDIEEDPQSSFYYPISGLVENRIIVGDGKLTIGNARFSIGQTFYGPATDASTANPKNPKINSTQQNNVTTWGELDLSKNYKISFCVVAATDNKLMQVYVNNNSTSEGNSIHGGGGTGSRIFNNVVGGLVPGKRVEINIPGETTLEPGGVIAATKAVVVGTESSFLQMRVESGSLVTIDDLWIGYQDDLSTEPAANTCAAGDHLNQAPPTSVPAAPAVTAGDSQLTVVWNAVNGASGYDVAWNTTNTPPTEAVQIQNATGLEHVITGLTNDTTYYVFVRAKNAGGVTEWSVSTTGTPVAAVIVPDVPTGLAATPGNTQVAISWTVDAVVTAYQVAQSATVTPPAPESGDWLSPSGVGTHTFSGLTNGSEYHFFVRAENSAGYSEPASVVGTPVDSSGAGSNREWLLDLDSYSNYTDELDFLAPVSSGNRAVNQADPVKSVNGLTFFKTDTGASIRFRDASGIINFNGSSFTSNARVINADAEGKLDQPLRNYVGVFVTPGEAVTVSFTWKQTTGTVDPSKVGLIDDTNTLLAQVNAINGADDVITVSLPAAHTSSEVRFFYSRENNTSGTNDAATGGIDLTVINRQYD